MNTNDLSCTFKGHTFFLANVSLITMSNQNNKSIGNIINGIDPLNRKNA